MNVETAQRLADLRRSKGFSQEGLARKLGLSRQAVSKWERAESSPDTENLISLAKLYGVSLDELLNPSDEIEDDIEFENEDRARQREAEAAERARTHEAAARATEAATQASDAAAKAAQAASWSAQAANAATAQATSGGAVGSTPVKGPFQSFPYWAVCWLLFFLLMFLFGAGPFAALIFFTIPIYHWVARALDGDWARGDIQVGPAPVSVQKANGIEVQARASVFKHLTFDVSYTYLDKTDGDDEVRTVMTPKHMASGWVSYNFADLGLSGLTLGAGVRYIGSSVGHYVNEQVPDVTLWDAAVSYVFDKHWRIQGTITNIADKEYVQAADYGTAYYGEGRVARATLTYAW